MDAAQAEEFRFLVVKLPDGEYFAFCIDVLCDGRGPTVLDSVASLSHGLTQYWRATKGSSAERVHDTEGAVERIWAVLTAGGRPSEDELAAADLDGPPVSNGALTLCDPETGLMDVQQLALAGV